MRSDLLQVTLEEVEDPLVGLGQLHERPRAGAPQLREQLRVPSCSCRQTNKQTAGGRLVCGHEHEHEEEETKERGSMQSGLTLDDSPFAMATACGFAFLGLASWSWSRSRGGE